MRIVLVRAVCHGFFTVVSCPKSRVSRSFAHVLSSLEPEQDSEIVIALFSQNVNLLMSSKTSPDVTIKCLV